MVTEKAPLIAPEQGLLLHLYLFGWGIVLFHTLPAPWQGGDRLFGVVLGGAVVTLCCWVAVHFFDQRPVVAAAMLLLGSGLGGVTVAGGQYVLHDPPQLTQGITTNLTGTIVAIDGKEDARRRLWVRLADPVGAANGLPAGSVVRISTKNTTYRHEIGGGISAKVRLYPPPARLLAGTTDFAPMARVRNVSASGYVITPLPHYSDGSAGQTRAQTTKDPSWRLGLARLRIDLADRIVAALPGREGGIAAALLVGDRRYISQHTYRLFQKSGLAHLLAISGLHMGLVCFGVMGVVRFCGALVPAYAVRVPLHKVAAVVALMAGGAYVLLSGGAISAVRAFLMAVLVVIAVLSDRMAVTMRNVALAAFAILTVNPVALFSASFQLSFAATSILVWWYESIGWQGPQRYGLASYGVGRRIHRFLWGLVITASLASLATAPFTAQHFGSVTPWGVIANIVAVPLTGLLIMPAGLVLAISLPVGLEAFFGQLMAMPIAGLVAIAAFFAELPGAGLLVRPPGFAVLALLVSSVFALSLVRWPVGALGAIPGIVGAVLWVYAADPKGVLFGMSRKNHWF